MGRHQRSDVPATPRQRRAAELLGVAIGLGLVATVAGVVALAVDTGQAQSVQADELPQPPEVSEPATPVAGPVQPIFNFADVVPWDPGKNGEGAAVEVSRIATSSRVPTSTPDARVPATDPGAPVGTPEVKPPPPPPPVVVTPPRDCSDPLVECACDHDPFTYCDGTPRTPVGAPPVTEPEETDDGEVVEGEPVDPEVPAAPVEEVIENVLKDPVDAGK